MPQGISGQSPQALQLMALPGVGETTATALGTSDQVESLSLRAKQSNPCL
ncbi:MAG TPA: hypothetical protein VFN29_03095 [Chiayiivirga sp.]|nr:hypothetical protein [Chiayiivirga sp.]